MNQGESAAANEAQSLNDLIETVAAAKSKAEAVNNFDSVMSRGGRAKWIRRTGTRQRGFRYLDAKGAIVTNEQQIERIKSLVLPPAWKHVRICPNPRGKLQALGVDGSGRVQYRYSEKFAAERQAQKFVKIEEFGRRLPDLRRKSNQDIQLEGYPKDKVLAVMIRLINDLYIRVGSEQSVKLYKTYGVTTLRNKHAKIGDSGELRFEFVGKHHIKHRQILMDEELSNVMHDLKSFGGNRLFNYLDENNKPQPLKPGDVNNYIKNATASKFSAKDFRTWGATVLAASELAEIGAAETKTQINKNIVRAVKAVAERLGNTPTVARKSYIHPAIIESYEQGVTINEFRPRTKRQISRIQPEYLPEEVAVLNLLESRKAAQQNR